VQSVLFTPICACISPQAAVGIQEVFEGVSFDFKFTVVSRQIFDDSAAEMGTATGDTHFGYACFASFGRR
jgi:hypothetical protein